MSGIFLQTFGFFGGGFGNLLNQLEQLGFFAYVLPFLLIFALVFGIMTKTKMFENKSINAIIALSVGLMSLQFGFVSRFFAEIFPNLGIGLAVILALLILVGLFTDFSDPDKRGIATLIIWVVGIVVFIVIIAESFTGPFTYSSFWFWVQQNFATIIVVIVGLGVVGWVISSQDPKRENPIGTILKQFSRDI